MIVNEIGAACFGVTTGYITYRTLVRTTNQAAVSDLAAVLAGVGGAAVTTVYDPASELFGWYAIGLLVGMVVYFLLYLSLKGTEETGKVMFAPTRVEGASTGADEPRQRPEGPRY